MSEHHEADGFGNLTTWQWVFYPTFTFCIVCFAGLMSGLTLGLLSIDKMSLKILQQAGTDKQKKYANRLVPILNRRHWLLVTLLLWNAAAMESLPLFLDKMVPEYLAIIISITLVLVFGEVLPQAAISRFGLAVGGNLFWFVWILIFISAPISWPLGKLLDLILGDSHGIVYKRQELKELMDFHAEESKEGGSLSADEVMVIKGALQLSEKTVENIMTPIDKVFMVNADDVLEYDIIKKIYDHGHSRIPVYQGTRTNIIGLLITKRLIFHLNYENTNTKVGQGPINEILKVDASVSVWNILNMFQTGKSHMAVINKEADGTHPGGAIGILTLEDVFEELIQEEITDETDLIMDVQKRLKVSGMFRKASFTELQRDRHQGRSNKNPSDHVTLKINDGL
ncbi:hypothetical protein AKO1_010896 [Acrasis kona]|uniref:Uncharacterized protein n=1 Tax=Acrasis kona TaxID=1008807 RepID=A0AAW2YH59_9EUKA